MHDDLFHGFFVKKIRAVKNLPASLLFFDDLSMLWQALFLRRRIMALDTVCFEVRNAMADDISDIITFLNERGHDLLQSGPIEHLEPLWRERMLDPRWVRVVIIRSRLDHRLVAVAAMHLRYTWRRGIGTIEYVLRDEDFPRCGLGRAIMIELIRQACEDITPRLNKIELVSEPFHHEARMLYESLGFKLVKGSDRHYELALDGHPLV